MKGVGVNRDMWRLGWSWVWVGLGWRYWVGFKILRVSFVFWNVFILFIVVVKLLFLLLFFLVFV